MLIGIAKTRVEILTRNQGGVGVWGLLKRSTHSDCKANIFGADCISLIIFLKKKRKRFKNVSLKSTNN